MFGNEKTTSRSRSKTLQNWQLAMEAGGWTALVNVHSWMIVAVNVANLPVRSPDPAGGDDEKLDGALVCAGMPAIIVTSPGEGVEKVWGYDPGVYKEPPCPSFQFGFTREETFERFKDALAGALGMGILYINRIGDVAEMKLETPAPGPDGNGVTVSGWVAGSVWYGGLTVYSGTYREQHLSIEAVEGPGSYGGGYYGWQFTVRRHTGPEDIFGGPGLDFGLALHPGRGGIGYRICVCPYQFAIWLNETGDGPETGAEYPRSCMVSMPWAPEEYTGHKSFIFVATNVLANIRTKLEWDGHVWFDDGPWSGYSFRNMILPLLRTRIEPAAPDRLTTTQGMLIADNAWVTARREGIRIIDNRICGKLWNCCVVHDHFPLTTIYADNMLDGTWVRVSSQNRVQKASVWWKVDAGDVMAPPEAV